MFRRLVATVAAQLVATVFSVGLFAQAASPPWKAFPSIALSPAPYLSYGFEVLHDGRLAVADFTAATLALYSDRGQREQILARPGNHYGELLRPVALSSFNDQLFLYDVGKHTLLSYDPTGTCRLDLFNYDTSPFGSFAVEGAYQYRMGYLAPELANGRTGCVAYRTDATGSTAMPFFCYQNKTDYDLYALNLNQGYVAVLQDRVYMAFPTELTIRIYNTSGRLVTSVRAGGRSAAVPVFDKQTFLYQARKSALMAWRHRYEFLEGLATLPGRVVVLIKDAGLPPRYRLETYTPDGIFVSSMAVADGATATEMAVLLRSDHRGSLYLLVNESSGSESRYRIDRYVPVN